MDMYVKLCLVLLGTFSTFFLVLNECRKIDGYKFPVYSTAFCPRNETDWNERSSALNCNKSNGYTCLPNEKFTELLEFCYTEPLIRIQKGYCLYLVSQVSKVQSYDCSHFIDGCHNSSYDSNIIFKYPACITIGNGCFLAEPLCESATTTTHIQETTEYMQSRTYTINEKNDWVLIISLVIVFFICVSLWVLYFYRRRSKNGRRCSKRRRSDLKGGNSKDEDSLQLLNQSQHEKKKIDDKDSCLTQKADSSKSIEIGCASYSLKDESKRQKDESKPKEYAPKKRLEPKLRPKQEIAAFKQLYGRPSENEFKDYVEDWQVVVALDIGTTYSGYAFWSKENPSKLIPGKWTTGSKEVLESTKTPNSLLLNQENEVIEFGYEADKIFKKLVEDGGDKKYRYFHQFNARLFLNDSVSMDDVRLKDHLGTQISALDVFSLSIRYLMDECIERFDKEKIMVYNYDIKWIITVPEISYIEPFMKKAAEKAGIQSDQLKLVSEPVAAANYVIKETKTVFGKEYVTTFEPDNKILVVDLGGGSADLTVLVLKEDNTINYFHEKVCGNWGGNVINEKIWEIMRAIFSNEIIDEFEKLTADFMDMESNIELLKTNITRGSTLQLPILPSLAELCKTVTSKGYKELIKQSKYANFVKVDTRNLYFEPALVEEIFDLTGINFFTCVDKLVHYPDSKGIKDIFLVGGFAQADFIVNQFKARYPGHNVIIPTEPVLAVLMGALMFEKHIDIIPSRIASHTYGFDAMRWFTDMDPIKKKRRNKNTTYCVDLFETMVTIGDSVDVGKTVVKEVFASLKDMNKMLLKFYQSDSMDPKFVTDPGCECIGKLSLEMPELSGGTKRSVIVSMTFGKREITVCAVDKTSNRKQETTLHLLGDPK